MPPIDPAVPIESTSEVGTGRKTNRQIATEIRERAMTARAHLRGEQGRELLKYLDEHGHLPPYKEGIAFRTMCYLIDVQDDIHLHRAIECGTFDIDGTDTGPV